MTRLQCGTEQRRIEVENSKTINGIEYLEIFINPSVTGKYRSLVFVGFFKDIPEFDAQNVAIIGGIRVKNIRIEWAQRAEKIVTNLDDKKNLITSDLTVEEKGVIKNLSSAELKRTLVIRPNSTGDLSMYTLRLQDKNDSNNTPDNFDPPLSKIDFSFKVGCPNDYDYTVKQECPPDISYSPVIDYMTKDFASFRRLMLDRFSAIVPDWKERNPSDLGIALIELLSYVGDNLSYYQDAVATESYLGTARRRVSIRRHARLLDYFIHDGCNARTWVCFEINDNSGKAFLIPKGQALLTGDAENNVLVEKEKFDEAIQNDAEVFETMYPVSLYSAHNEIYFYTWGDSSCYLPKGATSATLIDNNLQLQVNDVLIFEEVLSPSNWNYSDRDPSHVHAVHLTEVQKSFDKLKNKPLVEISWDKEDALPFNLCLYEKDLPNTKESPSDKKLRASVARGNVVLVDNGYHFLTQTIDDGNQKIGVTELLGSTPKDGKFRPKLLYKPLTFACPCKLDKSYKLDQSAFSAFHYGAQDALPEIRLKGEIGLLGKYEEWLPVRDLIQSDEFAHEFVTEVENDGTPYLRFGDAETHAGKMPITSTDEQKNLFYAIYRIGNGIKGNVGPETITRIRYDNALQFDKSIIGKVRNPISATGGVDPESIDQVRQYAPYAFLKQKRAVTESDYEGILIMHPEVQRARATLKWTGSWYTVFIAVDRKGSLELDNKFKSDLIEYLQSYHLAGRDIKILEPNYVSLYIRMIITVKQNHYSVIVKQRLFDVFNNGITSDGSLGFFHPDNFTFGQPVYLSQIYAVAMTIDGVEQVYVDRFERWGKQDHEEIDKGYTPMDASEIVRLDNDPNFPENGQIEFNLQGGL